MMNRAAFDAGTSGIENKLSTYNNTLAQSNCSNAVDFWVANSTVLPSLALDIVSAHASQACVERVFLVCCDITAGKRNRLSKSVFSRVFLEVNSKYY